MRQVKASIDFQKEDEAIPYSTEKKQEHADEKSGDMAGAEKALAACGFTDTLPEVTKYKKRYKAVIFFEMGCEMESVRSYMLIHSLQDIAADIRYLPGNIADGAGEEIIRRDGFQIWFSSDYTYEEMYNFFSQTIFLRSIELFEIDEHVESEHPKTDDTFIPDTSESVEMKMGRLHNVLMQNNFKDFSEYLDHIMSDTTGYAVMTLVDRITTNHTFFMRETAHFSFFKDTVLPYLKKTAADKDLRIWSAGCSTGEEPYTLAMIIDEFFGKEKPLWDTKILATDISTRALAEAKKGIYSSEAIASVPGIWKLEYFNKHDSTNYIIDNKIKNEVIFRKFNLMENSFPFRNKFHVIFCRNVMIYFDSDTRWELVNKFYDMMEYGGYLFIGHSETLNKNRTGFTYIMPAVYRKVH